MIPAARGTVRRSVILTLVFRWEGRTWTGECRELGTATYGRSLPKLRDELLELVTLHLSTLEETAERGRFFEDHRIRFYADGEAPQSVEIPVEEDSFVQPYRIPIPA